jgi:hypothetical protein
LIPSTCRPAGGSRFLPVLSIVGACSGSRPWYVLHARRNIPLVRSHKAHERVTLVRLPFIIAHPRGLVFPRSDAITLLRLRMHYYWEVQNPRCVQDERILAGFNFEYAPTLATSGMSARKHDKYFNKAIHTTRQSMGYMRINEGADRLCFSMRSL